MSSKNPYDDYDAFDPYNDSLDDDTGDFSFVEDEYDSMPEGVGDGFTYAHSALDMSAAQQPDSYDRVDRTFPKTQLRPAVNLPVDAAATTNDSARGSVLHRRKKRERQRLQTAPEPEVGYQQRGGVGQGSRGSFSNKPKRRRHRRHGCLITILVFVALLMGAYWLIAHPIDDRLAFTPAEQQTVNGTLSWSIPGMPYYVLALGSDAREGDTVSRTDTMVLIRVDFFGGKLTLVSIPRDTKVEIQGHGTSKINAAYAYGGAGGAVKAVSKLTNVPISHVAVIHFEELADLVDYLGGVTVNVPTDVYDPDYTGLSLEAGTQTLDGETALLWARTRHGFENGDYQRQADQRILITAIMNRMLSLSPTELPGALDRVGDLIGTDMRCYNLVPLFLRFKFGSPKVYSCAIPTTSDMIDGYWYEIPDEPGIASLMSTVNKGENPST